MALRARWNVTHRGNADLELDKKVGSEKPWDSRRTHLVFVRERPTPTPIARLAAAISLTRLAA
jgi:hypothetical protein